MFAYKKKPRRNCQLANDEGLRYSRVNNDSDSENVTIESATPSPTRSVHNNDDDPMIDL